MRFLLTFILMAMTSTSVVAQDHPNTILVLDGSGSMWGQIDGVAKIGIAQEVVGGLLDNFPPDQGLGLTVYGHRERGNCVDIETVVAPNVGTSNAIADAVSNIQPLGKTPMTDAVIAAAQALRYTEDSATVILISDGVETCNPDPCAAARLLEETGIDFTAHVIGFDVGSDADALMQMQCIAEETGGQFLTADNADQLSEALTTVVTTPEPEPVLVPITLVAIEGENGSVIPDPILWTVTGRDGVAISKENGNPLETMVEEGSYVASAYRAAEEITLEQQFVAIGDSASLTIVFPAPVQTADLIAPETAILGSIVQVGWDGPDGERDYVAISYPDETDYINYTYTSVGRSLDLLMPPEAGIFEIRYYSEPGGGVLATKTIEVLPTEVLLKTSETAELGEDLSVSWTGPDYDRDFISIGLPGNDAYINYSYTSEGSPLDLQMPTEPGEYEIRYQLGQGGVIIERQQVNVTELQIGVTAADTAIAGEMLPVGWVGPDYDRDFIAVGLVGDNSYINYTYTADGNPLELQMPTQPGEYEIKYQLGQDNQVAATRLVTVTDVSASLLSAETVIAGSLVTVEWDGPNYDGDFISVGAPGEQDYIHYTYTNEENRLSLQMPSEPGDYEIRYQLAQDNEIIATRPISTTKIDVSLEVPTAAHVGDSIRVDWAGPDYQGDYVSVSALGEDDYVNYTYTRDGSPLLLEMPAEAGTFEIRYQLGQGNEILQRQQIVISPLDIQLQVGPTAKRGEDLLVGWDGPAYPGDYISIARVGEDGYEAYTYTQSGNPLSIQLPEETGEYELRYVLRQGDTVVYSQPLIVAE